MLASCSLFFSPASSTLGVLKKKIIWREELLSRNRREGYLADVSRDDLTENTIENAESALCILLVVGYRVCFMS